MALETSALRVFIRVADLGSITAAARAMKLSKSSLSRTLTRLEGESGVVLLERSSRRIKPTQAGQILLERARAIQTAIEDAEVAIADLRGSPNGVLRVDAPYALSQYLIAPTLVSFARHHPHLRIELKVSNRRIDPIVEDVDVVLRVGRSKDSNLICKQILEFGGWLCASPTYLEEHGYPAVADDLRGHTLVDFDGSLPWLLDQDRHALPMGIKPSAILTLPEPSTIRAVLANGGGIGELPDFIAADAIKKGELSRVLPTQVVSHGAIYALSPNRPRLAKSREFIDALAQSALTILRSTA